MNTLFQAPNQTKHNTFISFHHDDEEYRDEFETEFGHLYTSKSVQDGDIDSDNGAEYTSRLINDGHISDSSVVVALYGANTKKRKHIDWEISAGVSKKVGGYSGLVIIILPTFPITPFDSYSTYKEEMLYPYLHPRTVANLKSGYAKVYFWKCNYNLPIVELSDALHEAHGKRISHNHLIDNSDEQYTNNLP